MSTSPQLMNRQPTTVEAARHICQEVRLLLSSLRGGPPAVAYGPLSQNLLHLRNVVRYQFLEKDEARRNKLKPVKQHSLPPDNSTTSSVESQWNSSDVIPPTAEDETQPLPDVGPYASAFTAVITDPIASGPHTLIALRCLYRLISSHTLASASIIKDKSSSFPVHLEPLIISTLACKFEQTDPGADEAVEMAIADLIALVVTLDKFDEIKCETQMEAFHTVFVTRNTFVHSPALCYHFEQVLVVIAAACFDKMRRRRGSLSGIQEDGKLSSAALILDFLSQQLLHTPVLSTSGNEAMVAHDATRVLSLRLARQCLRRGWGDDKNNGESCADVAVLHTVQDELCLSLLLLGQTFLDIPESGIVGLSIEVLSEICSTIALLWSIPSLRNRLIPQFEAIFSGFFQRTLSILRQRSVPIEIGGVYDISDMGFESMVEIVLQTLVDILCLQENRRGALEILYGMYDSRRSRSDVATGLFVELCRCCGGRLDDNGEEFKDEDKEMEEAGLRRQLPPHLKELCAEALVGSIKCLMFFDDSTGKSEKDLSSCQADIDSATENQLIHIRAVKRLMKHGAQIFNKSSTKGLLYLSEKGVIPFSPSPRDVATFLREGLILGLDKSAVGEYLGNVGKSPGKKTHKFEEDWFHKEALTEYCSLFRFENQSLLDGLRMFLSSFRLPGEAQQIDRILQTFAETCSRVCIEAASNKVGYFSSDEKKAADAAYLLAFSIIMLNTDQHNDNIRADKKMTMADFVKNNTNYGRDITEEGKELPKEYLEKIYESIKEEELRTEGEGADGTMTVERWKDALRGTCGSAGLGDLTSHPPLPPNITLSEIKSMVISTLYRPLVSAIAGLWGIEPNQHSPSIADPEDPPSPNNNNPTPTAPSRQQESHPVMARLGIDLSHNILVILRMLNLKQIFNTVFSRICHFSGLLTYNQKTVSRLSTFVRSIERQSAVVVAVNAGLSFGQDLGIEGWKALFGMVFELRDLKLLGGGKRRGILIESDPDLLTKEARRQWTNKVLKGSTTTGRGMSTLQRGGKKSVSNVFVAMSRALFGAEDLKIDVPRIDGAASTGNGTGPLGGAEMKSRVKTIHGKESLLLWHDLAPGDEDEDYVDAADESFLTDSSVVPTISEPIGEDEMNINTLGFMFEHLLMQEDNFMYGSDLVGGSDGMMDARSLPSLRAQVRRRLVSVCDFAGLISESRYFSEQAILDMLQGLVDLIHWNENLLQIQISSKPSATHSKSEVTKRLATPVRLIKNETEEKTTHVQTQQVEQPNSPNVVLSPASEAFAEVLLCEISLKSLDRFSFLWEKVLSKHYHARLGNGVPLSVPTATCNSTQLVVSQPNQQNCNDTSAHNPAIEKCITGLLRLSIAMIKKDPTVASSLLTSLPLLHPPQTRQSFASNNMGKHMGEGLWRICQNTDAFLSISEPSWDGIFGLAEWCAGKGGTVVKSGAKRGGLADDDPALQAFRSLHLLMHSTELASVVPYSIVNSINALITAGEKGRCAKLCVAGLDLLLIVHNRLEKVQQKSEIDTSLWVDCWLDVLDGMKGAAETSHFPNVRQHALSMLTDAIIDRHGRIVSELKLCEIVNKTCIPLAGRRITALLTSKEVDDIWEEVMIELEVCVSLIFKPFLHHLRNLIKEKDQFVVIWESLLGAVGLLLGEITQNEEAENGDKNVTMERLLYTTQELTSEHLRNAIMVLVACGVLKGEQQGNTNKTDDHLSSFTWNAVENMKFCTKFVDEWKSLANETYMNDGVIPSRKKAPAMEIGDMMPSASVSERQWDESLLLS